MTNFIVSSPKRLQWLGAGLLAAIALSIAAAKPASACLPVPGSEPMAIEQRVSQTPYVFDGTVTRVDGAILTLQVNRYIKGQGPETVRLEGFNQHSCQEIITESGGRYLFFGEGAETGTWSAVYDGAFGAVRRWSPELETQLSQLELIEQPNSPPENPGELPPIVADAVKQRVARLTQLPTASIEILSAEPQTWQDSCLGLPFPARGCLQALTEGWLVDVRAGNRELTYRTNSDGSTVYLETDTSNNPNPLPQGVADAVKREAAQLLGTPGNELEILDARPQTWPNGCLGLELPDRVCTQALVEGWLVTVGANDQKLVYRTDERGDTVLLDNGVDVLPASVREAVLDAAARDTGFPENSLRITRAVSRLWDGCLGVYANPGQLCNEVGIPGWQVTVEGRNSLLVYHTNQDGSDLLLNGDVSRFNRPGAEENSELPEAVAKAVLNAAARQTELQAARLRITAAQRRAWDGCLGIYSDRRACPEIAISGWRVTVEGQDNVLVYHANGDGSDVRLNVPESRLQGNSSAIEPISFSPRESPPPLPRDAIFRAVSAGGITGDVREIMLWEGGKITTRTGQSGRIQTRWVSPQQVQKFQQVLGQQRFSQYDRLSFPPPTGSADIIEVALSSRQGVMRYADYETQQFPQPLQVVLNSWQELLNSAEENPSVGEVQSPTSSEKRPQREGYPWAVERFILQWFGSFF